MSSSSSSDTDDGSTDASQSPLASVLGKRSRDRMAITYSDADRYRSVCYELLDRLNHHRLKASVSITDASYSSNGSLRSVSCQSQIDSVCLEFRYLMQDSVPAVASLFVSIPNRLESTPVFSCKPISLSPDSNDTAWIESRQFALTERDLQEIASSLDLDAHQALSIIFASVGIDLCNPAAISSRPGWLQHYSNTISGFEIDPAYESEDSSEKRQSAQLGRRLKRQKQENDHILQLYLDHVWKPL